MSLLKANVFRSGQNDAHTSYRGKIQEYLKGDGDFYESKRISRYPTSRKSGRRVSQITYLR
jgi:hypothetical protein